ncbi:MAG: aminotransferase class III-fold pyridoxal phosphate-dependent enzyme, partial [Thermodesulfobacteriota bacterium]|nr:aminotransferase class III-fold pyridoxal phosphate-dependent enzyme [Thermodesulfobacteriota bacterium]
EKLNEITPDQINRFFISNSGAEATEASVKLAKHATGRHNIIVMQGSFHGRTHLTMAMTTSKTVYRHRYAPHTSGIFVTPTPYAYFYGWDEKTTVDFCIKQLDLVLQGQTAPDETAAIIIEPVMGEGGYVPIPKAYLQHVREVCDEHGILLIMDEIQSGFGRTGKLFCFEHSNVKPDILIMAKGLGSGLPISAIGSSKEIMSKWTPGTHGGTYGGGSTIPVAAACATIDTIFEENLLENCTQRGEQLMGLLKKMKATHPVMGDVRGLGLMIAVEFTNEDGKPDGETCGKVIQGCLKRNLLLLSCGTYKNIIRWIPPLVVTESQIEDAVTIFEQSLNSVIS